MKVTRPFKYQAKGVRKIIHFDGNALLADEMGLGKSLQSLLYCHEFPKRRPVLIICPAFHKINWQREVKNHIGRDAYICYGRKPPKQPWRGPCPEYLIINYEILKKWKKLFRKLKIKILIVDEVHRIKNMATLQSKNVRNIAEYIPRVIALSGTPLTKRPAELWPTLNMLRPDVFEAFYPFAVRYCKPERKPWGIEYKGATRLPELHELLNQTCMIRRLKKDVLKDLPPKVHSIVPLELSDRKEYIAASKDFLTWLKRQSRSKALRAQKAERMVKTGYLLRLVGKLKVKAMIEWLNDYLIESDGKIIISGIQKKVLADLHEHYKNISLLVNGTIPVKRRQSLFDTFQNNKRIRIMFGNLTAAGVGWNGTAASAVGHLEFPWTSGELNQMTDRAHRIGQKNKVTVYYFPGLGTIDEKLCKVLQECQGTLDAVLDGKKPKQTDLDIYTRLENIILEGAA